MTSLLCDSISIRPNAGYLLNPRARLLITPPSSAGSPGKASGMGEGG